METSITIKELIKNKNLNKISISEFKDFSTFQGCSQKYKNFVKTTLKLNSCTNTGKLLVKNNRKIIRPILNIDNNQIPENTFINLNADLMIDRILYPKINKIPKSLAVEFTDENLYKLEGSSEDSDILNPNEPLLEELNKPTESASEEITKLLEDYDTEEKVKEVEKLLENVISLSIPTQYLELFKSLDKFQSFIDGTKYIYLYKDWKDIYKSLSTNCSEMKNITPNDDFLYYDEEHESFILPIDINTGKIRVSKFFEDLTTDEKNQANLVEQKYYRYKQDKIDFLEKSIEKTKNITDSENPFLILYKRKKENSKEVVNTLI